MSDLIQSETIGVSNLRDGVSPAAGYSLEVANDYVSVVTPSSGSIPSGYSWENTLHTAIAYQGTTQVSLTTATASKSATITDYYLWYQKANTTLYYVPPVVIDGKIKMQLSRAGQYNDETKIIYTLCKGTAELATNEFSMVKVKQGNDGTPGTPGTPGQNATSYWLVNSLDTIAKDKTGAYKNNSITFTPMKQTGTAAPTAYTATLKYKIDTASSMTTATVNSLTLTLGSSGDINPITSLYIEMYLKDTNTLVDKETINVVDDGADGSAGAHGINTAQLLLYKASATTISTTGITATAIYDFVNKTLTASDLNGWSLTLPSSTYPIYATGAIASSTTTTDDIEPGEWVTPTLFVKDGEDGQPGSQGAPGYNTATISLYQRTTTATPSKPTTTATYTFATGTLSTSTLNGWTITLPSGTNPCWVVQALALSTATQDTILSADWSTPVKLVENGEDGQPGAAGRGISTTTISYAGSQSGTSAPSSGWQATIPTITAGWYLWTKTYITYTDNTHSEYYSTAKDGVDGTPGTNGTSNESITAYYITHTAPTGVPIASPSGAPSDQNTHDTWTTYNVDISSSYEYKYRCYGNKTTPATGNPTYSWDIAELIGIYNYTDGQTQEYWSYLKLMAGEPDSDTKGLKWDDTSKTLWLNADAIKTGVLTVASSSTAAPLFYANVNSSSPEVSIAGWTVSSQAITKTTSYINTSGTTFTYTVSINSPTSSASHIIDCKYVSTATPGTTYNPFYVTTRGYLYSTSGAIAGWSIGNAALTKTTSTTISNVTTTYTVSIRAGTTIASKVFSVQDGASSYPFYVQTDGTLHATKANITGTVTANTGTIGGWTLATSGLTKTSGGYTVAIRIPSNSTTKVFDAGSNFYVYANGTLHATGANISGTVTMMTGSIRTGIVIGPSSGAQLKIAAIDHGSTVGETLCFSDNVSSPTNYIGFRAPDYATVSGIVIHGKTFINLGLNRGSVSIDMGTSKGKLNGTWDPPTWSSSRKYKQNIKELNNAYDIFFDNLIPRTFEYKDAKTPRNHFGLILDEVQCAFEKAKLTSNDVGAYCLEDINDPLGYGGLKYTEFVALNTWQIQKLKSRVKELEDKLSKLTS